MRIFYPILLLLAVTACDQNGGPMPVEGKDLLSTFAGPKIPTMEESQIEEAKNAEKNNDFAGAAQIYQQILERDPTNENAIQMLGYCLRRNGEYDKALSVYDSLIAKDNNNVAAKEGKALTLLSKGDYESPTALFQDVLKIDNKRWKSLNGMGILFVTRGLYPESIKYFEEALKQHPGSISIMNNLGLAQALIKQYQLAATTLSQASALSVIGSAERKRVDLNLAMIYASSGDLDAARNIAEIYLSGPALDNNLGLYAHLAKDDNLAKSYLNTALTESKIYYGKAWDNLETLNNHSADSKNTPAVLPVIEQQAEPAPVTEVEKTETAKPATTKKAKEAKEVKKKEPKKVVVPESAKSDKKSLSEIISTEIKKDGTTNSNDTQAVVANPVNSLEKSLGTVKIQPSAKDAADVTAPAAQ